MVVVLQSQNVKGQDHTVTITITVTWLLACEVCCCGRYAAAAGLGLHVI